MTDHTIHLGARSATIVHHDLRTGPMINADRVWVVILGTLAILLGLSTVVLVGELETATTQKEAARTCLGSAHKAALWDDTGSVDRWAVAAAEALTTGECRDGDMVVSLAD